MTKIKIISTIYIFSNIISTSLRDTVICIIKDHWDNTFEEGIRRPAIGYDFNAY